MGQGGEGRPQGHGASGSGSKNGVLSGKPGRLFGVWSVQLLPAGWGWSVRQQGGKGLILAPQVDGTQTAEAKRSI